MYQNTPEIILCTLAGTRGIVLNTPGHRDYTMSQTQGLNRSTDSEILKKELDRVELYVVDRANVAADMEAMLDREPTKDEIDTAMRNIRDADYSYVADMLRSMVDDEIDRVVANAD